MTAAALVPGRFPVRQLLVPGLSALLMLVVLTGLGVWQLHRLAWKRDLLDSIARGELAPAIPLPADPSPFQKVSVRGRLRDDLAVSYGVDLRDTRTGPALGAERVVPLERPGGDAVLVDLGWVADRSTATSVRPAGDTEIIGYVRPGEHPGWFSVSDDPAKRRFYTLDPAAIGAAIGLAQVAPFVVVALGDAEPSAVAVDGVPIPAQHLPRPPNDHLQYAITWFGLAATLVVIFGLFARKALRS